jgi:tetratricopeptide (TPR) repeat protein
MKDVALLRTARWRPAATKRLATIAFLCVTAVSFGFAQQADTAEEHSSRAVVLAGKGDFNGAIAEYQAELRLNSDSAEALNGLARLYATAKDKTMRNPSKALQYALQAVALDHAQNATYLDTLAKAYDAGGDDQNAVLTEKKALALQLDDSTRKRFQSSLNWYELAMVPADTTSFISYCTNHFALCRETVVDINNIMMIRQLGGNHGCTFPTPGEGVEAYHAAAIEATKAILEWLKANSTSRAPNKDAAIAQAMAALWPSQCEH